MLDRSAFRSDFLFEHNWRTRPVDSLFLTIWRSFWPQAFWPRVSIHGRIVVLPLLSLFLVAMIVFPVVLFGTALITAKTYESINGPLFPARWVAGRPSPPFRGQLSGAFYELSELGVAPFSSLYRRSPAIDSRLVFQCVLMFFGVATTLLCCLRQTLGRCKVRAIQVLRVTAYSCIPISFWTALSIVFLTFLWSLCQWYPDLLKTGSVVLMLMGLAGISTAYLRAGLDRYLQLPRPGLLASAALVVAWLSVLTFLTVRHVWSLS